MIDPSVRNEVIDRASKLRVPRFESGTSPYQRAQQLEDHLLLSAYVAADLAALRLDTQEELRELEHQWERLDGWENFRRGKTDASVERAKADYQPNLAKQLRDARWLLARCNEWIERMDRDGDSCNRILKIVAAS